jgi:hypothetical protein
MKIDVGSELWSGLRDGVGANSLISIWKLAPIKPPVDEHYGFLIEP